MIAACLPGDRLHLQHGPIDLVIGAEGNREAAFQAAFDRFDGLLERLVEELPVLRCAERGAVCGPVARRMTAAVDLHRTGAFVTPMAAIAGAVADDVLDAMTCSKMIRGYVNNGGDIALHLSDGTMFEMAIAGQKGQSLGRISVASTDPVRGIATSGQGGRSLSMGVAESVTVLASTAAQADVAATLIANAVDVPGTAQVRRLPASLVDPDSDLGSRPVVTSVGALSRVEVARALARGAAVAEQMKSHRLLTAAALFLRGQSVTIGEGIRSLADA